MRRFKGWKTFLFNLVMLSTASLEFLNAFPFREFISDKTQLMIVLIATGIGNLWLRLLTNTPAFKREPE
jgi:hypothetical protein